MMEMKSSISNSQNRIFTSLSLSLSAVSYQIETDTEYIIIVSVSLAANRLPFGQGTPLPSRGLSDSLFGCLLSVCVSAV